jgi:hypothetical protein
MNWLYYLAEANIYLGVFYLAYCLLLTKETYYTISRVYLLLTCAIAFLLPLIQLNFLKPVMYATAGSVYTPVAVKSFTWQDGLLYSYLTGVAIFTIQFAIKLYQLQKLARLKPAYSGNDYKLISLEGSTTAFSFFNYLFIGTEAAEPELITRHELVHIRQKHSADVIVLELFKIINWFNPAIYLLQNSLKAVHEYIADEQTALMAPNPVTYSTFLVNNAYGISGPSFTHSFFNYKLLKNRIIMLHQKRSGSLARLKYLIAVPLCAGLLCESTLGFSKDYGFISIGDNTIVTVQDTIKKKLPPPPPPTAPVSVKTRNANTSPAFPSGKIEKVTHIPATKNHPAVTVTDIKLPPPPPPVVIFNPNIPKPDVTKVKFPPRVVKPTKTPPPPTPAQSIRIQEPTINKNEPVTAVRIEAQKAPLTEIRIESKKAPLTEVTIEPKKAPLTEIRIVEPLTQPKPEKKP